MDPRAAAWAIVNDLWDDELDEPFEEPEEAPPPLAGEAGDDPRPH